MLFLRKKYNKNIDEVYLKDVNQEPKKWSLFGIVGIYSFGTYLTLKAGLVPKETTRLDNTQLQFYTSTRDRTDLTPRWIFKLTDLPLIS